MKSNMENVPEHTMVYQFKILKTLASRGVYKEYLGEHLFLGTRQRVCVIDEAISKRPECMEFIRENLRELATVWHPYMKKIYLTGMHKKVFFFTTQHYEGSTLKDTFGRNKLTTVREFYQFHSPFLDLFYHLYQKNIACKNVTFEDFIYVDNAPLLVNLNLFKGVERHLTPPDDSDIIQRVQNLRGAYVEHATLDPKEILRAIAAMMYETVGWGELGQAIKVKRREEEGTKKNKETSYVPLIPDIHPGVERILLLAYRDKSEGGYASPRELLEDFQTLCSDEETTYISPPSLEPEIETQGEKTESGGVEPPTRKTKKKQFEVPSPFTEPAKQKETPSPESLVRDSISMAEEPVVRLPKQRASKKIVKVLLILLIVIGVGAIGVGGIYLSKVFLGGENTPPVARATTEANIVPRNTQLVLDGSSSYDPDNDILSYYWEVAGDNSDSVVIVENRSTKAATTKAIFTQKGTFTIRLKVFDGTTFSKTSMVVVNVY